MPRLTYRALLATTRSELRQARSFLEWWAGELLSLVPPPIKRFFSGNDDHLLIRVRGDHLVFEGPTRTATSVQVPRPVIEVPEELRGRVQSSDEIVLLLPLARVLRPLLTLPAAALSDLQTAVPFLVERYTPFPAHRARFAYRVLGWKDKQHRLVELAVASQQELSTLETTLEAAGVRVTSVRIEDDTTQPAFELASRRVARIGNWAREPSRPLMVTAFAVLLAGPWVVDKVVHHQVALREAAYAQALVKAQKAQLSESRLRTVLAGQEFFDAKASRPKAIQMLGGVTDVLEDDSWAFNFEIDGAVVRLRGFSNDVPKMLRRLRTLPWVKSIDFGAPVVHEASQQRDRFDLILQIGQTSHAAVAGH